MLLTLCSGQRWQPSLMQRGFHRSCAGASQNRTRDPRSTTQSKGISRSWKKNISIIGSSFFIWKCQKIFFLPWNPLRRQFCAPPPNHICMLSLTISNDVDDVDDVDDRELDFKSIKRQKAKSNTHTQENEAALKSETCASCFSLCALATFLERGPGGFDRLDCQSFCPSTLARF